ncbi:succinyl-diaminopimelate desuccinylase [Thermobifida cellulosilytica]|uniref:Succinyl-diaminopimelate desuccinylase n=1 Tax=Thermobifida cellulosilytica TB100 TaxID=665004 RepID=A0A147KH45_THECS|nr:succinyl-diaminopimelate desuccinylase [Thermobifida cellulosilytica]KUP96617.1 succinyl-diaminopimelate desuccinylase [Thermobifida cellulosilytica TB100]
MLDLTADVRDLTARLVDIESVSGAEKPLADAVEAALRSLPHLTVTRDGDAVVARTELGRASRVVLAGHIDTVPTADNVPSRVVDGRLYGCGASDMKSGVAVQLRLAATVTEPRHDLTFVFYDCEEVEAERNGLRRLAARHPEWLRGDFAVLLEPTGGQIEGGCQGTMRVEVTARGVRAHSARSWMGRNAIHEAGRILDVLRAYTPRQPEVDGLRYHEGLNAVGITGGVAGNVVPDVCVVTVNYRFAPDRTLQEAEAHLREVFDGFDVRVTDAAAAARPGLDHPTAAAFVASVGGGQARAKLGWTDVARMAELGIPAVNYGPGEPTLAHTRDEWVDLEQVAAAERRMAAWLTGAS